MAVKLFLQTKGFLVLHGVVIVDMVVSTITMNDGGSLMRKGEIEIACKQEDGAGTEYEGCEPLCGTPDESVADYEQDK